MDDFTEFLYNFYWIIYLLIIGIADVLLQELRISRKMIGELYERKIDDLKNTINVLEGKLSN